MTELIYYPEMKEAKPAAQIEARLSHYGKHYYLRTTIDLPEGRGCKKLETFNGVARYKVTTKEYDRICQQYTVSYEMLLD